MEEYNFNQIALNKNGYPSILTYHSTSKNLALYNFNGDSWFNKVIDKYCKKVYSGDMVLDNNDMPHVVVQTKPKDIESPKEKMLVYYNLVSGTPIFHTNTYELQFGEVWT
ncbi:MAG: hypothetical protein JW717_11050 [Marinilabiliaceae bacterium]|nr:hypothetical protein [Marinilabiliaceae bacterium]